MGKSYEPEALLLEIQWLYEETTLDNSTGNFYIYLIKIKINFSSRAG